ncbi:UNVERIFIED_CONTAM: hypothetical protein Sradi_5835600 [Sesamum radiatum]|uniref:Uncharacterized protein n=1 Tax=Sesamum radiatum TaxID=300843 RepID=A0AAW2KTQ4_SESRA
MSEIVGSVLKSHASIDAIFGIHRVQDVSFNGDSEQYHNKQKVVGSDNNSQALQVVIGAPPTSVGGGSP